MKKNKVVNLGLIVGLLITLVLIGGCVSPEGTGETGDSTIWMVVFLIFIFVVFYFLTIRPRRKMQKRHEELVETLRKGDKVITAGGIYGQIESLSEDSIVLKIESGTTIRIARASVIGQRES